MFHNLVLSLFADFFVVMLSLSSPVQSLELRWILAIGTGQEKCFSVALGQLIENRTDSKVDGPPRNSPGSHNNECCESRGFLQTDPRCVYFLADPSALTIESLFTRAKVTHHSFLFKYFRT